MDKFEVILKEGLERSLNEYGIKGLNEATPLQRGKALTDFYLKEIGQYLYNIFEDDIDSGICDSRGDLGVDFIYRKENGEWLIIQAKYKGQKSCITAEEISCLFSTYSRIINEDFVRKHCKGSLKELLFDLNDTDPIHFCFVTNDKITARIEDEFEQLKKKTEEEHEKLTFELKGFSEIKSEYKCVMSEAESIAEEVRINIETMQDTFSNEKRPSYFDLSSVIGRENNYRSTLCTIKGTTLKGLYMQHRAKIFNYNIRGYLGDTAINKKMRDTLDNEPDKFYFYNNGISAICTDIIPEIDDKGVKAFLCKNFSIINGAQTTSTIGRYKKASNLKDVLVLLRITKAEDYKKEKGLNKKIITYNNSQSIIKASDFRSNDDIQIFLEKQLSNYFYRASIPHRRVVYLRKRVNLTRKKENLHITMESLARVLYVFNNDPILILKGTNHLFDNDIINGKYWKIFSEDGKEASVLSNTAVEKIAAVYFIYQRIEEKIKEAGKRYKTGKEESIKYQALLAKWHFLWAFGYLSNKFYCGDLELLFKKIAAGKIFETPQGSFIDAWFPKVHNTIAKCIEKNYQATRRNEGEELPSFNFKNWLRNSSDFEELVREFKYMEKDEFSLNNN